MDMEHQNKDILKKMVFFTIYQMVIVYLANGKQLVKFQQRTATSRPVMPPHGQALRMHPAHGPLTSTGLDEVAADLQADPTLSFALHGFQPTT